jgi:Na+/melibiose symporter-like transporter
MEGVGFLLIALFFGVICSLVAGAKGRSMVLWFIWGVLFLAFALLVIANLDEKPREPRDRQEAPSPEAEARAAVAVASGRADDQKSAGQ